MLFNYAFVLICNPSIPLYRPSRFTIVLKEESAVKRILAIITSSLPHVPCYISACLTAKIMTLVTVQCYTNDRLASFH